jgi:hypothetical protein
MGLTDQWDFEDRPIKPPSDLIFFINELLLRRKKKEKEKEK